MIRAGELRHRITIQHPVESEPTSTGQRDKTWPEWGKAWADIRALAGRELENARSVVASVSHTVLIRYREGVLPTFRVQWGDRVLWINAIVDAENRRREMVLYCTEEVIA